MASLIKGSSASLRLDGCCCIHLTLHHSLITPATPLIPAPASLSRLPFSQWIYYPLPPSAELFNGPPPLNFMPRVNLASLMGTGGGRRSSVKRRVAPPASCNPAILLKWNWKSRTASRARKRQSQKWVLPFARESVGATQADVWFETGVGCCIMEILEFVVWRLKLMSLIR